jgi:hypothetical protein
MIRDGTRCAHSGLEFLAQLGLCIGTLWLIAPQPSFLVLRRLPDLFFRLSRVVATIDRHHIVTGQYRL